MRAESAQMTDEAAILWVVHGGELKIQN